MPDPVIDGGDFNRNLYISSSKPGFVNVDWGDGTKEQYPLGEERRLVQDHIQVAGHRVEEEPRRQHVVVQEGGRIAVRAHTAA